MKKIMLCSVSLLLTICCLAQIDSTALDKVFEKKGTVTGNVYKISFPRSDLEVTKRAAITGDFVMLADEVNLVVKALTENGITPTAIHSYMLHDEPRLFMMHFWAVGDPEKLAKGLKAALSKTNSKM